MSNYAGQPGKPRPFITVSLLFILSFTLTSCAETLTTPASHAATVRPQVATITANDKPAPLTASNPTNLITATIITTSSTQKATNATAAYILLTPAVGLQTPLPNAAPCGDIIVKRTDKSPKITADEALQILKDSKELERYQQPLSGKVITNTMAYGLGLFTSGGTGSTGDNVNPHYMWVLTLYNIAFTPGSIAVIQHSYVSFGVDEDTRQILFSGETCGGPDIPASSVPNTAVGTFVRDGLAGNIIVTNPQNKTFASLNGFYPIFAPDGKRIAFAGGNEQEKQKGIHVVDLAGSNEQYYCPGIFPPSSTTYLLRWSPDGRYIALRGTDDKIITLCDTSTNQVSQPQRSQGTPISLYDWTPDSKFTIWESRRPNGEFGVYYGEQTKVGADAITITQSSTAFVDGRISPDGKTLAISDGQTVLFFNMPGQKSSFAGKSLVPADKLRILQVVWTADGQNMVLQHEGGLVKLYSLDDKYFGEAVAILTQMTLRIDWSRQ